MLNFSSRLCCIFYIWFGCVSTYATDYYFKVPEGEWHNENNWTPKGIPQMDDTVHIAIEQHCYIKSNEEACLFLDLGGTLEINNGLLQFGGGETSYIDGEIILNNGRLRSITYARFIGSGFITGGEQGGTFICWGEGGGMILEKGLTVRGNLVIYVDMEVNCLVQISTGEEIVVGTNTYICNLGSPVISGDGAFKVDGGILRFRACTLNGQRCPRWNMSSGLISVDGGEVIANEKFEFRIGQFDNTNIRIGLSGGELHIGVTFQTSRRVELKGCVVHVSKQYGACFG